MLRPTSSPFWYRLMRLARFVRLMCLVRLTRFGAVALLAVALGGGAVRASESSEHRVRVGGLDREFLVVAPARAGETTEVPAVLVFHGFRQTPRSMRTLTGWDSVAEEQGFLVVYPKGIDRSWNDGDDSKPATRKNVDDVGFIEALVRALVSDFGVDADRIYATGFSNGGFMLLKQACALRDKLAAVGIVAAGVYNQVDSFCDGSRAFPAMFVLGTEDPMTPWEGWKNYRGVIPSQSGEVWARLNKCDPEPVVAAQANRDRDGTRSERIEFAECADGASVVFYRVEGGGHTWPGGHQYLPSALVGRTARDWSATETLWEFFSRHPRRPVSPGLATELRDVVDATLRVERGGGSAHQAQEETSVAASFEAHQRELDTVVDAHLERFPHTAVEFELNRLGYAFLREVRVDAAIHVLHLNTQRFPTSFNAHDSLGEALWAANRREEAIESYRRAVELNPESSHSWRMLEELQSEVAR